MTATADAADLRRLASRGWKGSPAGFARFLTHVRIPPITGARRWADFAHSMLLSAKFREAATRPGSRQIWTIPPRYGKSLVGSTWGPAWYLDLWPHKRVMVASYDAELATTFGRDVRNILDTYPDHLRVSLREDSKAAHRWNTPHGGGMLTAGIMGTATGFGADLLVIDDPFKNWEEAHSETIREKVWFQFLSVFLNRLQPDASVIIIMTRWHEDDLVGRLLRQDEQGEGEGWEVVRLPAIADDEADPLGRRIGEVLCPAIADMEKLDQLKRTLGSYLFSGMFQQRPSPAEGGILKRGWWRFWREMPNPLSFDYWATSWDMAFKDAKTSSYVVGQLWGKRGADRYLVDQVRDHLDYPTTRSTVRTFAAAHPEARAHWVEDKANGPAIIADLRHEVPGLIPVTPKGDKLARVHAHSATAEAGNVYLPDPTIAPWVHDFIEEAAAFPNGANDDQVDAWSQAMQKFAELEGLDPSGQGQYRDRRLRGTR